MELILNIGDEGKIDKIIKNLSVGRTCRPQNYTDEITEYWKHHLSLIQIEKIDTSRIRVTGESGFYFPGMTYSGSDFLNTIHKYFGLMRVVRGTRFDVSIPQPKNISLGYQISGKWVSSDFLRAIHHTRKIILESEKAKIELPENMNILEIGSGTGIQALVCKLLFKKSTYFLVDFPETLSLAAVFLNLVLPESKFLFYTDWKDNPELLNSGDYDFVFVPNYAIEKIPDNRIQLAINTVSMQEMNYHTIAKYFKELRRILTGPRLFYQCNRDKKMGDVLIEVSKYPYNSNDAHLYQGRDEFHSKTIIMKKIFEKVPLLNNLRLPVIHKNSQVSYLTKLSKP